MRGSKPLSECRRGHPRTPENLYIAPRTGFRTCRVCRDARRRAVAPTPKWADPKAVESRFFRYVTQEGSCWRWNGAINSGGYGNFTVKKVNIGAHRWAYEFLRAPIPPDLHIDHLCRNRWCVNPWHLEPVTLAENVRRGESWNGGKTHCNRGHELVGDNLGIRSTTGHRYCRTCKQASDARRWAA